MEVLYAVCCGLDVHKASVTACLRSPGDGPQRRQEVRTFRTSTRELLQLADWLSAAGCTHVTMESTGISWRPVSNLLEGSFERSVVNAQHVKMVPGRKTDVRDSEWLAQLLELGLLRRSFVPPAAQRERRDVVRSRKRLIAERAREAHRVLKVLETATSKLGSVVTNVLGVSARAMLTALMAGDGAPEELADLAQRNLRRKRPALAEALTGRVTAHHRFMLDQLLRHIEFLDETIATCDGRIATCTAAEAAAVARLDTIPGVARRTAETIVGELGCDMTRFPTAGQAASWGRPLPRQSPSVVTHDRRSHYAARRLHCRYVFHGPDCAAGAAPSVRYGCVGDFKRLWATACTKAGFPVGRKRGGYVFHNTRHTAVTNLVNAGVPSHEAMAVSGHQTRSVFDRYSLTLKAQTRAALERVTAYTEAHATAPVVVPLAGARRRQRASNTDTLTDTPREDEAKIRRGRAAKDVES